MNLSKNSDLQWRYRPTLWAVSTLIIVFFIWANVSEIDQHIKGVGRVVPAGKARVIQHLEGGIVDAILVSEGQKISKGETIFLVANSQAKAKLRELDVAIQGLRMKQLRLGAERNGVEKLIFSAASKVGYLDLARSEKRLFRNNNREFLEKINGLNERLKQKKLRASELMTKMKNLQSELEISNKQMMIKRHLFDSGAISESSYLTAKSTVLKLITQMSQVEKEIPIIYAERTEILNLIEESKQKRSAEIGEKFNTVKINIKKLDEQINALQDEVKRTSIVSPINGIVNRLHINTIGGVIQPGDPLAEVTPVDESLIIEGKINTNDRGKIWVGLPVITKITAYDYAIYGGIPGELTYISSDSLRDNKSEFYQIKVTLSKDRLKNDKRVYLGMTAEMNILTGKISILHALLKPFWNIQGNALREI